MPAIKCTVASEVDQFVHAPVVGNERFDITTPFTSSFNGRSDSLPFEYLNNSCAGPACELLCQVNY